MRPFRGVAKLRHFNYVDSEAEAKQSAHARVAGLASR